MSAHLDLHDVAGMSPVAEAELAELLALLADCGRIIGATESLFAVLPEKYRAAHLAPLARELSKRIKAILEIRPATDTGRTE